MPQVFRNLLSRLPEKNKIARYLLYAVGEIMLVVIGILIAVEIGNINEERKSAEDFRAALRELELDLMTDISQTEQLREYYETKDSLARTVLRGRATREQYENEFDFRYLVVEMQRFEIHQNGYNKLQKMTEAANRNYETLFNGLNDLYGTVNPYLLSESNDLWNYKGSVIREWERTYPWFNQLTYRSKLDPIVIDFMMNDWRYKNNVKTYHTQVAGFIRTLSAFQRRAINILHEKRALENGTEIMKDSRILEILKFDTLKLQKCPDDFPITRYDVYNPYERSISANVYVIKNEKSIPIQVFSDYDFGSGIVMEPLVVKPGALLINWNASEIAYIIKDREGNCLGSFISGKNNGFVVIQ